MDFLRVLSATCDNALEEVMEFELSNIKVQSVRYQEQLEEVLEKDPNFNLLIMKQNFPGAYHPVQMVKNIRESYPHIRIIFIITTSDESEADKLKTYLYSKQVYDLIYDHDFTRDHLLSALFNPKTSSDTLDDSKKMSFDDEFNNINAMEKIATYGLEENARNNTEPVNINYNNNIKYNYPPSKVISFWSPKSGTGVDTLAINTAVMLAKNTDIDVCLVDLSETPNMHLHFNLIDNRRNIESIYSEQVAGKLSVYTVDNYIVNGSETQLNLPNLHILPGAINRINFYKKIEREDGTNTVGSCFEEIIDILREKYTVVILILSSSIYHLPTVASLRRCSQINMILENDVSCFYNANRFLDTQYGIFHSYKIDRNKCKYIINKFYVKDRFYIEKFMGIVGSDISACVGLIPEEIFSAVKNANPLTLTERFEYAKMDILGVINTITYMEIMPQQAMPETKKGFLNNIFNKNK